MKKKHLFLTLISLLVVGGGVLTPLHADVKGIITVNPIFEVNSFPSAPLSYIDGVYQWNRTTDGFKNLTNNWWMKSQDYWLLAYNKASFLDLGFEVNSKNFNLVARFDIMQDPFANMTKRQSIYTNIPFVGAGVDLTFPRVGYADFTSNDGKFYASLGRRLIKWGPGFYDIQIADSQPYLDNLWLNYATPLSAQSKWIFDYNYVVIAPKTWLQYENTAQKTILGHKFSLYNENMKFSVGELANIYNKVPSLFDLSPLVVWHNGNQDEHCNVTLYLSGEGKIGPVRMFGTFNMDDFAQPHEVATDRPMAMGFSAGVEYHVFDGTPINAEKFKKEDYVLREKTFKVENGLNIALEWYYVTPMMYNRQASQTEGKFTIPWQIWAMSASNYVTDRDAFFLGFRYGPNSNLFRLSVEYIDNPFEASFVTEVLTRGTYGIESTYGEGEAYQDMNLTNMFALAGKTTTALLLSGNVAYYLQDSFKAFAAVEFQYDFTHNKNAFAVSLGCSINPLSTDWKNLF